MEGLLISKVFSMLTIVAGILTRPVDLQVFFYSQNAFVSVKQIWTVLLKGESRMQVFIELLSGLGLTGNILKTFIADMEKDKLYLRRGNGFWTIAEHMIHLDKVQTMLTERIERFIDEPCPEFTPFIPRKAPSAKSSVKPDVSAAVTSFIKKRETQLRLLDKAPPEAWHKTGRHPEYEQYSLYILVRHILMHDHWHMYRMEELWLTRDSYLTHVV